MTKILGMGRPTVVVTLLLLSRGAPALYMIPRQKLAPGTWAKFDKGYEVRPEVREGPGTETYIDVPDPRLGNGTESYPATAGVYTGNNPPLRLIETIRRL